jgi:hypothetical protein
MTRRSPFLILLITFGIFLIPACNSSNTSSKATIEVQESKAKLKKLRPFTRLFIQDLHASTLKWADLRIGEENHFELDPLAEIEGFKPLDSSKQKLVQMKEIDGKICVGIRDEENGAFESGWVLLHSGVDYIDHGDHGHWMFKNSPQVWDSRRDKQQGNPAHLYVYDKRFFLANDKLNGYTRIDPSKYEKGKDNKPTKDQSRFLLGGGNHITLAVVEDKVGYSAWIDGAGPNKGRVDVTPISESSKSEPVYSFHLPTGGIHGAITNSGKVFFAPMDGICWVEADTNLKLKSDPVKVNYIPLGKEGDKPRRTGAFVNHRNYVVFTTGKETQPELILLNAKESQPKPIAVSLKVNKGNQIITPEIAETEDGKAYAFVFHDHPKDLDVEDVLDIIALDPNGDQDCSDSKVIKTLKVGKSAVEGHFGHHDMAFDGDRKFGFFTNPGDGTVSVLSLKTLEIVTTLKVGNTPTAIIACGSRESLD